MLTINLHLLGGPHDGMMLLFEGESKPNAVDKILAGGVKIIFDGETYSITKFDKIGMRGVGVWEAEKAVTE